MLGHLQERVVHLNALGAALLAFFVVHWWEGRSDELAIFVAGNQLICSQLNLLELLQVLLDQLLFNRVKFLETDALLLENWD